VKKYAFFKKEINFMYKITFAIISLTCNLIISFSLSAQSIKIKNQDVMVNDSLYCKIEAKKGLSALTDALQFSILSLQGKELIFVKEENDKYLKISFIADGAVLRIKKTDNPFSNDKKEFIKKMFAGNLLHGDSINPEAKKIFIIKNDVSDENRSNASGSNQYTVVERNTGAAIFINDETVTQDGKIIGSYKETNETVNGEIRTIISFYLPGSIKVARLTAPNFDAGNNTLLTLKDNRSFTMEGLSGDMFANKNSNIEKIVKWLVDRGYL